MKLQFDADLPYQKRAVESVTELFEGQNGDGFWAAFSRTGMKRAAYGDWTGVALQPERLLHNLNKVQARNGLPLTSRLESLDFDVEMETGTGKTYVYLRTMLELHRRYGLSKFIVVVPGIAVREGVYRTLEETEEHFKGLYGNMPYEFFIYDGKRPERVRSFAADDCMSIMLLNIGAFRKSLKKPEQKGGVNVIHRASERLGGFRPIELIRSANPVVIIDEPQSVDTTPLAKEAVASLNPLFILRYSATHVEKHSLIYRLDAAESFRLGLVKEIEVAGREPREGESASREPDGDALREAQIRRTIEEHLDKELRLYPLGIKVLSLFFIDRVANYRYYDKAGRPRKGTYAKLFEKHYRELAGLPKYRPLFERRGLSADASRVHGGYFARDGRGRYQDTKGTGTADEDAYSLIMREKERLLSFETPLRFLFSHSALREGWDNPNVFQICTLNETKSSLKKRQELGRGLRLCVDQEGRRFFDGSVNVLTVVANESYEQFAASLQREYEEEGVRLERGQIKNRAERIRAGMNQEVYESPEFKALWEILSRGSVWNAGLDSARLIRRCLEEIDGKFTPKEPVPEERAPSCAQPPDLPDLLYVLQSSTGLTRRTVARILSESGTLPRFPENPGRYIAQMQRLMMDVFQRELTETISCSPGGELYGRECFLTHEPTGFPGRGMFPSGKSVYRHILYESKAELAFARTLEGSDAVRLYLKLPGWCQIPTPAGPYHPDWAVFLNPAVLPGRQSPSCFVLYNAPAPPSNRAATPSFLYAKKHCQALDAVLESTGAFAARLTAPGP